MGNKSVPFRVHIDVTGVVQGVGFRPTAWRVAREMGLAGFVCNSSAGVEIEVEGARAAQFAEALRAGSPPLARIDRLEAREVPARGDTSFVILSSREAGGATDLAPDIATCPDCLRELADPSDRRFGYPFVNCTNCGPRYSITLRVPYDRPNTTMAPFTLCTVCDREYRDPADRRFHAQPNACPACGPTVSFRSGGSAATGPDAISAAIGLLRAGGILALKGLGGYQLACDATDAAAVARLRERKRRSNKAFALMASSLDAVRTFAALGPEEEALLESPERPIVLLARRPGSALPDAVAPASAEVGCMLPNTPLHWLLFHGPLTLPSPRSRGEGGPGPLTLPSPRSRGEGSPGPLTLPSPRSRGEGSPGPLTLSRGQGRPGPLTLSRGQGRPGPPTLSRGEWGPGPLTLSRGQGGPGPLTLSRGEWGPGPLTLSRGEWGPGVLAHRVPLAPLGGEGQGEGVPGNPHFIALVMTSGNLAEEPIVRDADTAARVLSGIADAFLDHDRGILMRVDDSVVRRLPGRTVFVRRARGYVPVAIPLPGEGPPVLGCGGEVKNTFALTTPRSAIVSQHIGDLENLETLEFFLETLANLQSVYRVEPVAIAHDLHPGYFSTRWALDREGVERWGVQHHWAHIASVLAETGLAGPVIGVALDGSGYGTDGSVWGGEFLVADARSFERAASFLPVPLPGGEGAVRHPWRMALSYVASSGALPDSAPVRALRSRVGETDAAAVLAVREDPGLSPPSSGAGRLLEAAAALAGLCDRNTFEGEAAMRFEAAAAGHLGEPYGFSFVDGRPSRIDFFPAIRGLLDDLERGGKAGFVAARFHATVAAAVVEQVRRLHRATGIADVALSGGVFQNRLLLEAIERGVAALGLRPHTNTRVPPNDGGLSLGQAYLLRERIR